MSRRWIGWVLTLLVAVPAVDAETIRVATINVANYLESDRMVEGVYRRKYPKPEHEKKTLRDLLRFVNADVVAFQEFGTEPFLIELQRDLARSGLTYSGRIWMRGKDEERHLALLTRLPVANVYRHDDLGFGYLGGRETVRRGLLEVVFGAGEGEWRLFNLHLKSRYTERREDPNGAEMRGREAGVIRDLIRQRLHDRADMRILVLGDFNDTTGSAALARFTRVNDVALLSMIPASDSRGETWTYFFEREDVYSRVDYILASPSMSEWIKDGRGIIVDRPEWRTASDHRLVYVDIVAPAASQPK